MQVENTYSTVGSRAEVNSLHYSIQNLSALCSNVHTYVCHCNKERKARKEGQIKHKKFFYGAKQSTCSGKVL